MRSTKFQQIRIRISEAGQSVRHGAELDKNYKFLKGIYVSIPEDIAIAATTLGLKIGQYDLLDPSHEAKLLTSGQAVSPNSRFFLFPEVIDANGATLEVLYTDGAIYPLLSDVNADPNGVVDTNRTASKGLIANSALYPQNPAHVRFPYDARIYLWLTNIEDTGLRKHG